MIKIFKYSILPILVLGIYLSQLKIEREIKSHPEKIYFLPKKNQVKFITAGFGQVIADVMWLRSYNYFLRHFYGDKDYEYLSQMYEIITEIDPRFKTIYLDAMAFLTNNKDHYILAEKHLLNGLKHLPNDWELNFQLGILYSYFIKDNEKGTKQFEIALEKAPKQKYKMLQELISKRKIKYSASLDGLQYVIDQYHGVDNKERKRLFKSEIKKFLTKYMEDQWELVIQKSGDDSGLLASNVQLAKDKVLKIINITALDKIISINKQKVFLETDGFGLDWVYSKRKNKKYSFELAIQELKHSMKRLQKGLNKKLDKYRLPLTELQNSLPQEKKINAFKLLPAVENLPDAKEVFGDGEWLDLSYPLYPIYDRLTGSFRIPELEDLDEIPYEFK